MRRIGWAAALCVAAVGFTTLAPSAEAQTRWFSDAYGDVHASIDLHKVQVAVGSERVPGIKVVVVQRSLRAGDAAQVWFDVDSSNPGPEYRAGWIANSDAGGLVAVDSFGDRGTAVPCRRMNIRAGEEDPGNFSVLWIPRACLGNPDAVRVSVKTQRDMGHRNATDWGPRAHTFYQWVERG
jgi:hypothetical protein